MGTAFAHKEEVKDKDYKLTQPQAKLLQWSKLEEFFSQIINSVMQLQQTIIQLNEVLTSRTLPVNLLEHSLKRLCNDWEIFVSSEFQSIANIKVVMTVRF